MLTNSCRRASRRLLVSANSLAEDGQDLIEYALLTGIIAIAGILRVPDDPIEDGRRVSGLERQRAGNLGTATAL